MDANDIDLLGIAGGKHPLPLDTCNIPLFSVETTILQPVHLGALVSTVEDAWRNLLTLCQSVGT